MQETQRSFCIVMIVNDLPLQTEPEIFFFILFCFVFLLGEINSKIVVATELYTKYDPQQASFRNKESVCIHEQVLV